MQAAKRRTREIAITPALFFGRLGLTPNALTIIGSLLTASVGLLIAQGWFIAAGIALFVFSATDTLDGALARATNRVTVFGAFLDSVCDRYAEAAVFFGISWYFQTRADVLGTSLSYAAIVSSLMVSYARARAEGVGIAADEVGWFQRPERIITLGLALLLTPLYPPILLAALTILTVFTTVTVLQRVFHVANAVQSDPHPTP